MSTHQHQVLVAPNCETQPLAAAAGSSSDLLAIVGIQEPTRSRILALQPPATAVLAWVLEALSAEQIVSRPAFVASALLAGHPPPPDLDRLVRLPVFDWLVMAAAAREARTTGRARIAAHLAGHFEALYARLGRLDPSRWPILLPGIAEEAAGDDETEEEAPTDTPADAVARAGEVWDGVLADLRTQMDPATFNAWLKSSQVVRVDGDRWTVAVRSQTAADWLGRRLLAVIRRAIGRIAGRTIDVEFEVED